MEGTANNVPPLVDPTTRRYEPQVKPRSLAILTGDAKVYVAGETANRVYVVDSVHDAFLDKLVARVASLRPGADADASYGPITMPSQLGVIRAHIEDALARGGRAVVGGAGSVHPPYVDPVVLVDVPADSAAMTDETFGPTLAVTRVRDADEAVDVFREVRLHDMRKRDSRSGAEQSGTSGAGLLGKWFKR